MSKIEKFFTRSASETIALAKKIALKLKPKDILFLAGKIGSGKTTFTRGVCQALGVKEPVTSPSFVIVSEYNGKIKINHIDLYRLNGADFLALPIEEYYIQDGITIIEWADRLPQFSTRRINGLYISFRVIKKNVREIKIEDLRN